jgi:ATP-dependent Clp protease ATP-binding subunit ClpA
MFERFTKEAREVVLVAVEQARELGHDSVGPSHLFLGLLGNEAGTGTAHQVLHDAGLTSDAVQEVIRRRTPGVGFLTDEDAESLRTVGIDLAAVLEQMSESFGPDAVPRSQPRRSRPRFGKPAKKTLQLALRESIWLKAGAIRSEHILLAVLRCDDNDLNAVLAELNVKPDDLRKATLQTLGRAA